jgi:hypothetical protein
MKILPRLSIIGFCIWIGSSLMMSCTVNPSIELTPVAMEVSQQQAPASSIPQQKATGVVTTQTTKAAIQPPDSGVTQKITARLNEPFTLKIQQSVTLQDTPDKFGIFFHGVISDSRCPRSGNCVINGEARIYIGFLRGELMLQPLLELTTNPKSNHTKVIFQDYEIQLQSIAPYPIHDFADKEIASGDYEATFVVRKVKTTPTPLHETMSPTETDSRPHLDQPFTLAVGQSAELQDITGGWGLSFQSVTLDQRCPRMMECYNRGEARIQIKFMQCHL